MPINCYVGLHGNGKSYSVVESVIVPALKSKRRVWTNIPIKHDAMTALTGSTVTQFEASDIASNPDFFQTVFDAGAVCVIDECWDIWPAGMKADKIAAGHKDFFAKHRHMVGDDGFATEIVLITQDNGNIATFIRNQIQKTFLVHKLAELGMSKRFNVHVINKAPTGDIPKSKYESTHSGTFKQEIYDVYVSQTANENGVHGLEVKTDDRVNYFKSPQFRAIVVSLLFFSFLSVYLAKSAFSSLYGSPEPSTDQVTDQEHQSLHQNTEAITAVPVAHSASADDFDVYDPNRFAFLSEADHIAIVFNNGVLPYITYKIEVVIQATRSVVSAADLKKIGYSITPINHCLIRVVGSDYDGVIMCGTEFGLGNALDPIVQTDF